jgi:hypothetical protein
MQSQIPQYEFHYIFPCNSFWIQEINLFPYFIQIVYMHIIIICCYCFL